jgi:hypothetical protein
MRRYMFFVLCCFLILMRVPMAAQETIPPLATNTPRPPQAVISTPAVPLERYALRIWREQDLVDALLTSVRRLAPGAVDIQKSIRLIQYELQQRFPGAPIDSQTRENLLMAMLAAPAGSVDMRFVARPYIESLVNTPRIDYKGFQIEIQPANVDGTDPIDAVLHVRYPDANAPVLYEDYLLARIDNLGRYHLLESSPALPAAPIDDIRQIKLMGIGDFNQDGNDELALAVLTGDINQRMLIYSWRSGGLVNIVQPGEELAFGSVVEWPANADYLKVKVFRTESPAWQCLGEQPVTWTWNLNFFRPAPDPSGFSLQGSPNCIFYGLEPIFELPVLNAINTLQEVISLAPPPSNSAETYSLERAKMMIAMLHVLNGQADLAMNQAREIAATAQPGSWLSQQSAALIAELEKPDFTGLRVCAALVAASKYGACDITQVLTRLFTEQPLHRDEPIEAQLGRLGIAVQDTFTISQVGRVNRQGVHFNLAGDHWWAFAPLNPDFYTAERVAPLPGYENTTPPTPLVVAPQTLYNALLVENNPTLALTLIDNLIRNNPDVTISPEVRFIEALSYDLLNNRARARQAYFDLWGQSTLTIWGQLAAAHLEQR